MSPQGPQLLDLHTWDRLSTSWSLSETPFWSLEHNHISELSMSYLGRTCLPSPEPFQGFPHSFHKEPMSTS